MFPADADGEAVAALALALLSQAEQIGHAAGGDATGHVVVELDAGPVVVTRLDRQHSWSCWPSLGGTLALSSSISAGTALS